MAEFDRLGAVVLGCSADRPETLARFREKHHLNFTLLSDPEFAVIDAYGARRMKRLMGKSFLGIVRSTCLISPEGRIAHCWESAPSKGHAAEVLQVLKEQVAATRRQKG